MINEYNNKCYCIQEFDRNRHPAYKLSMNRINREMKAKIQ